MNAFTRAYEFLKRKSYHVLFYNDPLEDTRDRVWSKLDYLKANEISLYTNRAIEKRAEKVAEVEFFLRKRGGADVIDNHPLLQVLQKPNEFHTGRQFWGLYQKYKDLLGEVYIWVERGGEFGSAKAIKGLHLLRPDLVKRNYAPDGTLKGVTFSKIGGGTIDYQADEIIYDCNPDPQNPLQGMPLIKAGIRAIDTEVQLSKYHTNVIRNGGNVGNVFKFKQPSLTKQQMTELREQYDAQFAEAKNSGKPMFLGGDADIIKLSLTPEELSYLESKRLILDDICIMTGVPKAILSVTSGETFANADASIAIFLRETIKPLLTNLTSILDWRLIPEEFDLEFVDPTPENVELKLKRIETGIKNSYLTINEAREMEGLDPVPDGDQILVPFSVVPLDTMGEKPDTTEQQDQTQEKSGPLAHPLRDGFIRERYGKLMVKRMDRSETKVRTAIKSYFLDQKRRLIEYVEGARTFRRKDLFDDWFSREVEIRIGKGTLLPLIRSILVRAGQDAVEFAGASREFVLSAHIETWLDKRAHLFANEVTDTTYDRLKRQFSDSLEAGETRPQLVKRIRETYAGFEGARADTIARTEVHAATQDGTISGYKQAGLSTKIWVAVMDEATRDSHAMLDGDEVPIDHPFGNGLMYPGDPSGDAEEVINCRCSI